MFAGNEATLAADGQQETIAAPAGAPFLVSDNMTAGFALIPAMLATTGVKRFTLACVCGSFVAVPVTVTGQPTPPPQGIPLGEEGLSVELDGQTATSGSIEERSCWIASNCPRKTSPSCCAPMTRRWCRCPSPVPPTPLPLPTPRYASRDVSIQTDDGVRLAGTLTIPMRPATPLPGFVLVHGSGCNERDETIGPNKIFAQLASRLSNDGYAVLRYDKRSCGKSGGKFPLRDRLISDARDAIAYLRAQPGIDPKRIYVLGHSEGGELAPSIAIADGHLRGIVCSRRRRFRSSRS